MYKALQDRYYKKIYKPSKVYLYISVMVSLISMQIGACSSDTGSDLYAQYNLFCDIVGEEYAEYQKSDKSTTDKMGLIKAIEDKVDIKISSAQVKQSYSMIMNVGGEDPYELLKHDVKSRTGKDFNCDAFKLLTKLNTE